VLFGRCVPDNLHRIRTERWVLGTLGNGWALCDAGENETDGISFAFAETPQGESAGDDFGVVEGTFAASAEVELEGLSGDPGFGGADTGVDFQVSVGNLERSALGIERLHCSF